jgi:ribosomal protein RSM22 (predicted rRNA methylase)
VQLPTELREWIERRAETLPFAALQRAASEISAAYRERRATAQARLTPEERVAAYLAVRAPATYAAARAVLEEVRRRCGARPQTLLDIGAGAGTAAFAAREVFPDVDRLTLIEADPALARAGRELVPTGEWRIADARREPGFPEHDFVLASYALAELQDPAAAMRLWRAARLALVIIEAGTPAHAEFIQRVRAQLLAEGACMIAPCPGREQCPLPPHDWCHFAVRVERSSLHRRLKKASLGYEDEKFSYVAVSRRPAEPARARIIRRPLVRPGLISLEVCFGDRVEQVRAPKSNRELFQAARKAAWGDEWSG